MRSLQNRFLLLVLLAVLLPVMVVGMLALRQIRYKSDNDAVSIMNLTCQEEADKINSVLANIEKAVELEVNYALRHLDDTDRFFDDEDYRRAYTEEAERLFVEVAESTDGAVTFYFRYNAEDIASTQGFLYTRDVLDSSFVKVPLTDISLYDPDDTEHVGWYYIPVRKGIPTWMSPYQNKNLGIYMISYVIPLFKDGRLIGIIGMDVNFQVIINQLQQIHPYRTGYAFLTGHDGGILYHPALEYGVMLDGSSDERPKLSYLLSNAKTSSKGQLISYHYRGEEKKLAYTTLQDGSVLSMVVNASDINEERNLLLFGITAASVIIAAIFMTIAFFVTKRALLPLHELADTADQVASGNLDVQIPSSDYTELKSLIGAYYKTVERMREQYKMVDDIAHKDALTGLYNRSSFREKEQALNTKMQEEAPVFAVVMIDVNNLKGINDTYGHEAGDLYLQRASKAITSVFGDEVYRIGGDEFAIFLESDNAALENDVAHKADSAAPGAAAEGNAPGTAGAAVSEEASLTAALTARLDALTAELEALMDPAKAPGPEPWNQFSAACGVSISRPEDSSVADVFERADNAMYVRKTYMKNGPSTVATV